MESANIHPVKRGRLLNVLLLLSFGLWQSSAVAQTIVYTVGTTVDCDYNTLRTAIAAAAAQTSGTAFVRISFPTVSSLGYSFNGANSVATISGPGADVRIYGGYASCSATVQTPDTYTTLTYFNAAADATHSMLAITNSTTTALRRRVIMRQIRMVGAFDEALGGPAFGGAVSVTGNAQLELGDTTVSGFHATNGGGVSVAVLSGTDTSKFPGLVLFDDSAVDENTATYGGGVFALLGRVRLFASSVSDNKASKDGGGIYIVDLENAGDFNVSNNVALVLEDAEGKNRISSNMAGGATYLASEGRGGGIFSRYGHIDVKAQTSTFSLDFGDPTNSFNLNKSNWGGAIYMEGPSQAAGGPFTLLRIDSSYFGGNSARSRGGAIYLLNAADATVSGSGGPCGLGILGRPLCSGFFGNTADGTDGGGVGARGGAFYLRNLRADTFSRPIVRVYGNMFSGNDDPTGLTAVAVAVGPGSNMLFNRNIFVGNHGSASDSVLIESQNGENVNFRYNTVLESNTTTRMFAMSGGELDVTGSILWGTFDRTTPFHFVWFPFSGATMQHAGCLVIRSSDAGTSGVPNPELLWAGYAPDLDARYAPRGGSPAIDHCDNLGGAPPADAYGNGVYDTPGIAQRYGNNDLGAVEQTDIIFAHTFGQRPTN